ncbi:MAG: ImmA/IrrE family metallo-endopeptidase [Bacteroidota bacterium]|jgi:Zn-dependent peptidase ImmA (M78 family)|nr:ImmA/IrrE family metallo-endopeptidase [Bacteroidota bacterium]
MNRKDIEKVAEDLIQEFGITTRPVPVHIIANNKGCVVKEFDDDKNGVSGVFMVNDNVPTIGFNVNQSKVRQRFTIAHELGHFMLHSINDPNEVFVDNNAFAPLFRDENSSTGTHILEQQANAFAAALLMPEKFVVEEIKNMNLDLSDDEPNGLKELASKFNVSELAMSFRLVNLHLVQNNNINKRKADTFKNFNFNL